MPQTPFSRAVWTTLFGAMSALTHDGVCGAFRELQKLWLRRAASDLCRAFEHACYREHPPSPPPSPCKTPARPAKQPLRPFTSPTPRWIFARAQRCCCIESAPRTTQMQNHDVTFVACAILEELQAPIKDAFADRPQLLLLLSLLPNGLDTFPGITLHVGRNMVLAPGLWSEILGTWSIAYVCASTCICHADTAPPPVSAAAPPPPTGVGHLGVPQIWVDWILDPPPPTLCC